MSYLLERFSLEGKVALLTGGSGVLGSAMARGLSQAGAKIGIYDRRIDVTDRVVASICDEGGEAMRLTGDVLIKDQIEKARDQILDQWGHVDILVNAAGGNSDPANVPPNGSFFDLDPQALQNVMALNWFGTLLPVQVFGKVMADQKQGCIINISSMAAQRPMTRVVAYASAKAAIDNLTRWLAIELTQKYGAGLRVNAIAPGFFVGEQNRRLLLNEDGSLTARGQLILSHTPAGKFGEPEDLIGALIWLCSPSARFVNGTVIPVDGGFSAFSGV